jgi:hypothetical protein
LSELISFRRPWESQISYAAKDFFNIPLSSLDPSPISVLSSILSHADLKLSSENRLCVWILGHSRDSDFDSFLEHTHFEHFDSETFQVVQNNFKLLIRYFNNCLLDALERRMTCQVPVQTLRPGRCKPQ